MNERYIEKNVIIKITIIVLMMKHTPKMEKTLYFIVFFTAIKVKFAAINTTL